MSTLVMVYHRAVSSTAVRPLRLAGLIGAYAFALVTGTAILIAAIGSFGDAENAAGRPGQITAAELVMQQTAERGVQPSVTLLLAARTDSNDKRGF